MELKEGKFYRVDYSKYEPNFIIGKFEKTDGYYRYWEIPYFSQWKEHKSTESNLWTISSPETSIREATEEDMTLFNDYVINGKKQVFEQQYLFKGDKKMKALEILETLRDDYIDCYDRGLAEKDDWKEIEEAIKELEDLENRSCSNCSKYKHSEWNDFSYYCEESIECPSNIRSLFSCNQHTHENELKETKQ